MFKCLKRVKGGLGNIFLNNIVNHIPCWWMRKCLYMILGMKIGKNSRINMGCIIMKPWNIKIGCNTMINEYVFLDGRDKLIIGDSCSISMRSIIYTASHYSFSDSFELYKKTTVLGDCCWVGAGAVVLPGSELKDFTIIAANSCFKGVSEEKGIYCGIPAIKVKERNIASKYHLDLSVI